MTYHSPLADLYQRKFTLDYSGTLDDILTELEHPDVETRALHPPRIIRAAIDHKIRSPSHEAEQLVRHAIDAALNVYRHEYSSAGARFRTHIQIDGLDDLLAQPIRQPDDSVTRDATHPQRSQKTAERIAQQAPGDILFIALAHGGVAAGMDVYLRHCEAFGENSIFYAVRLSTQKICDAQPQLSFTELNYLRSQAVGRQVVIFDEDKASGTTLSIANRYFQRIFPHKDILIVYNLGMLEELAHAGIAINTNFDPPNKKSFHTFIKETYHEYALFGPGLSPEKFTENGPLIIPEMKKGNRSHFDLSYVLSVSPSDADHLVKISPIIGKNYNADYPDVYKILNKQMPFT